MQINLIDPLQPSAANGPPVFSTAPPLLPGLAGLFASLLAQQQTLSSPAGGHASPVPGASDESVPSADGALLELLPAPGLEQAVITLEGGETSPDALPGGITGLEAALAAMLAPVVMPEGGQSVQSSPEQPSGSALSAQYDTANEAAAEQAPEVSVQTTGVPAAVARPAPDAPVEVPVQGVSPPVQVPVAPPNVAVDAAPEDVAVPTVAAAADAAPDTQAARRAVAAMRSLDQAPAPAPDAPSGAGNAGEEDGDPGAPPRETSTVRAAVTAVGSRDAEVVFPAEAVAQPASQGPARHDAPPLTGVERVHHVETTRGPGVSERSAPAAMPEPPPERSTLPSLSDNALKSIRYLASGDRKSLHIRMVPASLGEVRVEVSSTGDGKGLEIRMTSVSPAVRDALEGQLAGLRDALQRDGLAVGRMVVSADASAQQPASDGMPGRHAALNEHGRSSESPRNSPFGGGDEPAPGATMRQRVAHHGVLDVLA